MAADVAAWSRLTGFREVLERLRPKLRTFRDEHGRELFDVPDAPLPDPDTPAPTRLLPEYDNAVLSHADRSRYMPDTSIVVDTPVHGSVLHDGFLAGAWSLERAKDAAVLTVRHRPLGKRATQEVLAEAARASPSWSCTPGRRAACAPSRRDVNSAPRKSCTPGHRPTSSARAASGFPIARARSRTARCPGWPIGRDGQPELERRADPSHLRSHRTTGRRSEDRPRPKSSLEPLGLELAGGRGEFRVVEDGPDTTRDGSVT